MKIFIAHSMKDAGLARDVHRHLLDSGHIVMMPENLSDHDDVLSAVSASIRSADVFLAFVTSTDANIYYELGLAAGASVPLIIAAKAGELLPSGLTSVPFVQLTGDSLRDAQTIARRIEDLRGLVTSSTNELGSGEKTLQAAVRDPRLLESISPMEFERLVAELFLERGYSVVRTPNGSADLIIERQGSNEAIIVEVKKMSRESRVSVETVRRFADLVSHFGAEAVGILVSTSGFTSAAVALAASTPIALRTLEDLLGAKSNRELFRKKSEMEHGRH